MRNHSNKACRHFLESLSDYVDGELEDELCKELERHMDGCENCQIVVDTLRKTIYLYRSSTGPPDVPADVRDRLFRRLDLDEFASRE
jgi:anti-sigma factor (TIGR02949 family)